MRWACFRQKKIEGPLVYPPVAADLEARKNAALDQAINRRGVHAQYFGNFADSEKFRELFHSLPPGPFIECATSDDADSDSFEQAETTHKRQSFVANFPSVWMCSLTSNAEIEVNLVSNRRRIQQC